eukprot:6181244-Pleurochrysis_carterae.AAC.1
MGGGNCANMGSGNCANMGSGNCASISGATGGGNGGGCGGGGGSGAQAGLWLSLAPATAHRQAISYPGSSYSDGWAQQPGTSATIC